MEKGSHSVAVQRQDTVTAGGIKNAQVSVFVTYAALAGHALIDRSLYLPRSRTTDRDRCAAGGVPDDVGFATKPALATTMISNAVQAGMPASWVGGDEVYGADPRLRRAVRAAWLGYVLQVAANRRVPTAAGPMLVDELAAAVPARTWHKASAGRGSKGDRVYSWAWVGIHAEDDAEPGTGQHHLLIRRNYTTGELAYHRCYTPRPVPLMTLVRVVGQRWRIRESFRPARASPSWTSTRSGAGPPGTAGPPCVVTKAAGREHHHPDRADRAHSQRAPPAPRATLLASTHTISSLLR